MKTLLATALVVTMMIGDRPEPSARMDGVWRAVEVTRTSPEETIVPGPNLSLFSATHYSRVLVAGPQTAVADPHAATADELRAAWGSFVGEAGTYEMTDRLVTLRPIAAKSAAAVGKSIVFAYRWLDNDTLLLTAVSDRNGPVAHPETIRLVRVE